MAVRTGNKRLLHAGVRLTDEPKSLTLRLTGFVFSKRQSSQEGTIAAPFQLNLMTTDKSALSVSLSVAKQHTAAVRDAN